MEDLAKLKKEFPENLKKIKEAKQANDFGVSLPLSHLVILTVLIKKNEMNLFFLNECRGSLKELIEVLLDDNNERFFSKPDEVTKYINMNSTFAKALFDPLGVESFQKIGPFTISKEDWNGFIKEYEAHLSHENIKNLNDSAKTIELIKYAHKAISNFIYGKAK